MTSTEYKAPCSVVFSSPQSPRPSQTHILENPQPTFLPQCECPNTVTTLTYTGFWLDNYNQTLCEERGNGKSKKGRAARQITQETKSADKNLYFKTSSFFPQFTSYFKVIRSYSSIHKETVAVVIVCCRSQWPSGLRLACFDCGFEWRWRHGWRPWPVLGCCTRVKKNYFMLNLAWS